MDEQKVFGACPQDCPDTCAMLTTVRDGVAVKVRGNPEHPFTRGGLCVKVNDYEKRVSSKDRILYPLMRRSGPPRAAASLRSGSPPGMRRWARSSSAGPTSSSSRGLRPSCRTVISARRAP